MMPDAELVETQGANLVFTLSTMARASRVTGRPYSMREKGRRKRLVPDSHPGRTRQSADIVFGESGIEQRRNHVVIGRSLLAGTEIALVVQVDAIRDGFEAASLPQFSISVKSSSLQKKQRCESLRTYSGRSSSEVATTSSGMPCSLAKATASES